MASAEPVRDRERARLQPRIGIGALHYRNGVPGGLNRYTDALLAEIFPLVRDLVVYAAGESPPGWPENRVRTIPLRVLSRSGFAGNLTRFAWQQARLPSVLRRDGIEVYHAPVPEGMLRPVVPQVITVHDVLPLRFPDSYPRLRYYSRHLVPRLISASAAVIVDSESTAADVRELYPAAATPIHVIHPGYDDRRFRLVSAGPVAEVAARYRLSRFVLAVGETRPYKNLRRLIQAFGILRKAERELELVIVGAAGRHDRSLREIPSQLGIAGSVRFLGAVPDSDLAALYGAAEAFVFPSLYEGFGMPPLEAMACGCPVIASRAASVPEVCGEAAVYFDPLSSDEIAAAIRRVTGDATLQETLRQRGMERVGAFTYRRTAQQVLELLQNVAHASR